MGYGLLKTCRRRRRRWNTVNGRSSTRLVRAATTWFSWRAVDMVAWSSADVCVKTTAASVARPTSWPTSTASAPGVVTASCRSLTPSSTPCIAVPRRSCHTWKPATSVSQVHNQNLAIGDFKREWRCHLANTKLISPNIYNFIRQQWQRYKTTKLTKLN